MAHFSSRGLSLGEVLRRRAISGKNEIIERETAPFLRFLRRFIAPITLMIEVALILSAILGRWEDFSIIAVLLLVNVLVDFVQEQKAHTALAALSQSLAPTANVMRDGVLARLPASELVPGDIVKLAIGDIVPADGKVCESLYLEVDQSALTGESFALSISGGDTLYSGSVIMKGSGYFEVTAIGVKTSIGKSMSLVVKAGQVERSHFQIAVLKIGKFLIIISSVLIALTAVVLILRGESVVETIRFALVLTIASIPVALPTVLSVTMAIGANALAKRHTIVSNFKAIEELAGVDVLCIDKTGTLTKNEIAVVNPIVCNGYTQRRVFEFALLALQGDESPIERAVSAYAKEHSYQVDFAMYPGSALTPFDPSRKLSEVSYQEDGELVKISVGAAQAISALLTDANDRDFLDTQVEALAEAGYRIIALLRNHPAATQLCGILPLIDPLRSDSAVVLADIQARGIAVKMLTGDNTAIAKTISAKLAIGDHVLSSVHLRTARDAAGVLYQKAIEDTTVFTEVVPEDKYTIVAALQAQGHIVAMTGDGVNDAPALKKADIGIAVSGATPAARLAADVILLDEGLDVIREAITLARATFARMQSYATFRISETIRIVCFLVASIVVFNYTPLTAIMIIMLALLNDIPVMAIAYDNVAVSETPVRWQFSETLVIATVLGITGLISSFGLLYYLHSMAVPLAIVQTIIFLKLDVAGHSTLYITRTGRKHFWSRPFPSLKFFIPAFSSRMIGTIIAYFGIFMAPISFMTIVWIWIYGTVWFLFNDWIKLTTYRLFDRVSQFRNI